MLEVAIINKKCRVERERSERCHLEEPTSKKEKTLIRKEGRP